MQELVEVRQSGVLRTAPSLQEAHRPGAIYHTASDITPYFACPHIALYKGDSAEILATLEENSIDCIVTSPPYYGQRDYDVEGQLGLEAHPQLYINKLVAVFRQAKRVLKPTGSLWVNIGDTYWSGKGKSQGIDNKQKYRRFNRPQDKTGEKPWCGPKQLLLIPHRFAIEMQNDGWIVRNDNIWFKPTATPDPVKDRCALDHEFVFHFVKQRRYYFDTKAVAVPSRGKQATKTPPSVWTIPVSPSHKTHRAVFPEQLMALPIKATCPSDGVLLDPFCGSATALITGLTYHEELSVVGIDISEESLIEAIDFLKATKSVSF